MVIGLVSDDVTHSPLPWQQWILVLNKLSGSDSPCKSIGAVRFSPPSPGFNNRPKYLALQGHIERPHVFITIYLNFK